MLTLRGWSFLRLNRLAFLLRVVLVGRRQSVDVRLYAPDLARVLSDRPVRRELAGRSDVQQRLAQPPVLVLPATQSTQPISLLRQLPTLNCSHLLLSAGLWRRVCCWVPDGRRYRSISPARRAHSSKPTAHCCSRQMGQTDRQTDTVLLHRFCQQQHSNSLPQQTHLADSKDGRMSDEWTDGQIMLDKAV